MKMRYFLRGLGVGVLLATLLLCISYRGQNSENSIIKQAKELGMQFPEKMCIRDRNEDTCVVYGMPRAVVQAGIVNEVVPLEDVADTMIKHIGV